MKIKEIDSVSRSESLTKQTKFEARIIDNSRDFSSTIKDALSQSPIISTPTEPIRDPSSVPSPVEPLQSVPPQMPSPLQMLSLIDHLNRANTENMNRNPDVDGDGHVTPRDLLAWIDSYNNYNRWANSPR